MVTTPLIMFIVAVIIKLYNKKQEKAIYCRYILFIFPAIISLVLWFITAPDPRFAGASFWYLGAGALAVKYQSIRLCYFRKACILTLFLSVAIALFSMILYRVTLQKKIITGNIDQQGFYMIPYVELQTFITKSGLIVYTPKQGAKCWDAPLPCTPYFNADLRLRIPGKLASGFTVALPQKNAEQGAALDGDSGEIHPCQ